MTPKLRELELAILRHAFRPIDWDAVDAVEARVPERVTLDRARIEVELPDWLRLRLPELLRVWGVRDPTRWPRRPELVEFLSLHAALQVRDRYVGKGYSPTAGLRRACTELGLPFLAVKRKLERGRQAYLESGDKMSPTDATRAATLEHTPTTGGTVRKSFA